METAIKTVLKERYKLAAKKIELKFTSTELNILESLINETIKSFNPSIADQEEREIKNILQNIQNQIKSRL